MSEMIKQLFVNLVLMLGLFYTSQWLFNFKNIPYLLFNNVLKIKKYQIQLLLIVLFIVFLPFFLKCLITDSMMYSVLNTICVSLTISCSISLQKTLKNEER